MGCKEDDVSNARGTQGASEYHHASLFWILNSKNNLFKTRLNLE